MAAWSAALPLLLLLVALIAFEERVTFPSCETLDRADQGVDDPENLKVMMVADLLLLGPDGGLADLYFRDAYTAKFLRKSFERLKPDILVVLGDISANGSKLTNSRWLSLLKQFQKMLGPFSGHPLHIVLGDRDIGECRDMDPQSLRKISGHMPGLDSSGCGSFEISNISFVSLNSVAMLCGNSEMRLDVEMAIERESLELRVQTKGMTEESEKHANTAMSNGVLWRENHAPSGSGPVLLLHFPLHQDTRDSEETRSIWNMDKLKESSRRLYYSSGVSSGPYELHHTLPLNATEYIFQSIRPRMVFSAHSHRFFDHTHTDGTREVTVPSMSWAARDDPGFIVATFGHNKTAILSRCYLARESHVLMAYFSVLFLLLATTFVMSGSLSSFISGSTSDRIQEFVGIS